MKTLALLFIGLTLVATSAWAEAPYRTFLNIQHYYVENSGNDNIANVRVDITFPGGQTVQLPEGGQYWPIAGAQVQEINRVYEIPFSVLEKDAFKFRIQMDRKGSSVLPCEFDVQQIAEFNRSYVCKVDLNWQTARGIPEDKLDKEGIQVRVFTDKNSPKKDIPMNAIAMKLKAGK